MGIKFFGDLRVPTAVIDIMITDSLPYYNRYLKGKAIV